VLTAIAMVVYGDDYRFGYNFLSELGATHTWSGTPNHAAAVLFGIALASLGCAFVAFAGAWRTFAFARGRARAAGIASQLFGTTSGAAFVAVAVTPVNLALDLHNGLVIAAFGLLFLYAATMTFVWWRNGAAGAQLAASVAYLLLVGVYLGLAVYVAGDGHLTEHGRVMLVISQKIVAGASMLYIAYMTVVMRAMIAP
jgi:hypothetical protein